MDVLRIVGLTIMYGLCALGVGVLVACIYLWIERARGKNPFL